MTQTLTIPETLRQEVVALADSGAAFERISQHMASAHLEKILAIRLLADAAHIPLGEAKKIIHTSPAWEFRRASDDQFHSELDRATQDWHACTSHTEPSSLRTGTR